MGLLITTKNEEQIYDTDLHLFIKNVEVSAPSLETNLSKVRGRNGQINYGSTHIAKTIVITAWLFSKDEERQAIDRDRIYDVFSDEEPFYITELFDSVLYRFERPGETTGFQLVDLERPKYAYRCRYYVLASAEPKVEFIGRHEGGFISNVSIELQTAELPYGESLPRNEIVQNGVIPYRGTAKCSQLESPFTLKATAQKDGKDATFTIQDRTLTYTGSYKKNDVFEFNGVSNLQNAVNINDKTNYEYFILTKDNRNQNTVATNKPDDFLLEVVGYKELYK